MTKLTNVLLKSAMSLPSVKKSKAFAMKKILFAVAFFLAAHSYAQQPFSDCVQKKWHYISAKDERGKDFKKVAVTDVLSIKTYNGQNKFRYDIAQENIHAAGTW